MTKARRPVTTFRTRPGTRRGLSSAERARTLVASAVELRVGVLNIAHEVHRHAFNDLLQRAAPHAPGFSC